MWDLFCSTKSNSWKNIFFYLFYYLCIYFTGILQVTYKWSSWLCHDFKKIVHWVVKKNNNKKVNTYALARFCAFLYIFYFLHNLDTNIFFCGNGQDDMDAVEVCGFLLNWTWHIPFIFILDIFFNSVTPFTYLADVFILQNHFKWLYKTITSYLTRANDIWYS